MRPVSLFVMMSAADDRGISHLIYDYTSDPYCSSCLFGSCGFNMQYSIKL